MGRGLVLSSACEVAGLVAVLRHKKWLPRLGQPFVILLVKPEGLIFVMLAYANI